MLVCEKYDNQYSDLILKIAGLFKYSVLPFFLETVLDEASLTLSTLEGVFSGGSSFIPLSQAIFLWWSYCGHVNLYVLSSDCSSKSVQMTSKLPPTLHSKTLYLKCRMYRS